MRKLVKYILFVFVLFQLSFGTCSPTVTKSSILEDTIVQIEKYHFRLSTDSSFIAANINYFQLVGESDLANVVNNIVLNVYLGMVEGIPENPNILIEEYFAIQNKEIEEDFHEMGDSGIASYLYDYTAKVVLNNKTLFTLKQIYYEYTGGAHGNGGEIYYNLDAKTGDKLKLSDLFSRNELSVLTLMGEKAFREAQNIPINKTLNEMAYEFENGFSLSPNFLITDTGIVFYYGFYEIACYAMGDSMFELPFELIRAKMPTARLFNYVK
ncbi:MAG: DUF3298 domain-containing protein [Bacteroidales bacterium]|nr:DUF3298 domain-containing protein [Bacteroidales bacterium]